MGSIKRRSLDEIRADFPTYEEAIAEIRILDYTLRLADKMAASKKSEKKTQKEWNILFRSWRRPLPPKKGRGAPVK